MVLVQVPQCARTRRNMRNLRRGSGVTSQDRQVRTEGPGCGKISTIEISNIVPNAIGA